MNEINITAPVVAYATKKITLAQLGLEIAEIISQHPAFPDEPRLQRIRDKFSTVEDEERFDAFLNDLMFWCSYTHCKLTVPGNNG